MTDYRLSPLIAARIMGAGLVLVGVAACVSAFLIAKLNLPPLLLSVVVLLALVVLAGGAALSRASVVRLTPEGYKVRFVRGAGVAEGRWTDVKDAVTAEVAGSRCVVLRLRDGRTTNLPVGVLAGNDDDFVRVVQSHLNLGNGLRPLG